MALDRVFDPLSQVSQIITSLQNCPQSQLPQSQLPQSESVSEKTSQSKAQDHNLHHLDYMPQTIFEPNFGNQSITPAQTSFHCALCSTFFCPQLGGKTQVVNPVQLLEPWDWVPMACTPNPPTTSPHPSNAALHP